MAAEAVDTERKALAVVLAIRDRCASAEAPGIEFYPDLGSNSLTIVEGGKHTRAGDPAAGDEQLVGELYELLVKGRGLSAASGGRGPELGTHAHLLQTHGLLREMIAICGGLLVGGDVTASESEAAYKTGEWALAVVNRIRRGQGLPEIAIRWIKKGG